ncbi:ABC transporter permease [Marisediminicola antarctica]|uniref:Transport permease protein n=1 Tax=Marisediminicola antarctica TaxID=674079 RepID=A0A7L5AF94_9MICO|nr:ABC transporter permease [Marisediminicola antarctica]QHO68315.1 ABC transporter [Marisediminicola antarctica]
MSGREVLSDAAWRERVLAGGVRPRRYGSWYVAEHRIRSMRSYGQTILATSIGNPLIYLFALGIGLATLVDANLGDDAVQGVSYLVFVAPALLGLAAVMVSAEEFTYPIMLGFKWNPIFFGMNAAPITGGQITNGILISVLARMVPTCVIYFIAMVLFGAVPSAVGILMIPIAVLTAMSVGLAIMAYTARIEQDKGQMALIMRFGITPMLLFSGTFFPLSQLPVYLQWIGWISPLWHGTELGRVISYSLAEPAWLTAVHVLYPAAIIVVCWRTSQRVFTARLNK